MEASAAQRARGKDLIMANSSRTMREDLPVTAVTGARPQEVRLETQPQQIGGRSRGSGRSQAAWHFPVVDLAGAPLAWHLPGALGGLGLEGGLAWRRLRPRW